MPICSMPGWFDANLDGANLSECGVYGIAVWNVSTRDTTQSALQVSPWDEPMVIATDSSPARVTFAHDDAWHETLTVDDIEIAQYIYLMLNSEKLRTVIEQTTTKVVLVLGSFKPEQKLILDALRDALREQGYFCRGVRFREAGISDIDGDRFRHLRIWRVSSSPISPRAKASPMSCVESFRSSVGASSANHHGRPSGLCDVRRFDRIPVGPAYGQVPGCQAGHCSIAGNRSLNRPRERQRQ